MSILNIFTPSGKLSRFRVKTQSDFNETLRVFMISRRRDVCDGLYPIGNVAPKKTDELQQTGLDNRFSS